MEYSLILFVCEFVQFNSNARVGTNTMIANGMSKINKVVVFGGAGFIGSHLLQRLAADNPRSELYSIDINSPRFSVPGVRYINHDVRQPIPADIAGTAPALIFNLAAVHTTPGHEDWEYYWTNVLGANHVCQFATECGSTDIVFTSSISVYGPSEAPKDEDCEPQPTTAYGRSKLMAESVQRLWQADERETRRVTIVRPAVIYGFTERGNFTRLATLLKRRRFIYPGRKDTIKSCGYVKDLVSSMLFMRQHTQGVATYNFCYPERYTSADICEAFGQVAGYPKPRAVAPIQLMLLGGLGFELLNAVGIKTNVNRARVKKLFHSTNIIPKRLNESGFKYAFDLRTSLSDWRSSSPVQDFN